VVSVQLHEPLDLPLEKKVRTYWVGDWVGPTAGPDAAEEINVPVEPRSSIPQSSH
jgi:hypothetical protein